MSTWESLEALTAFVYGSAHSEVMRARRKWFAPMKDVYAALWWVPLGHRPTVREAEERVASLPDQGPTAFAFTFKNPFGPPFSPFPTTPRDEACRA
jgi:hypothetical protein